MNCNPQRNEITIQWTKKNGTRPKGKQGSATNNVYHTMRQSARR